MTNLWAGKNLTGKKVLVVGLGRSGVAATNFLVRRGAETRVTDVKTHEALASSIAQIAHPVGLQLGSHSPEDFVWADLIVLSPGVPASLPELELAREKSVPILSEVELAYQFLSGTVVAITGSNGKTTTTTLVDKILRHADLVSVTAGNIGSPLMDAVVAMESLGEAAYFVVELSSFQLETIQDFRPNVAALLNITPDHMDRYPSFQAYVAAKKRIFMNQGSEDFGVVNADDPICSQTQELQGRVVEFSRTRPVTHGAHFESGWIHASWEGKSTPVMRREEFRLKGDHNLENALAALAIAQSLQIDPELTCQSIRNFRGVEHRLEFVATAAGVDYYNDSKATNVASAIQAIHSFSVPVVVILGGRDKGGDFVRLGSILSRRARAVVLLGEATPKIRSALNGSIPIVQATGMGEAVRAASELAVPSDVVLLAPACSSFDMFKNFEHRGKAFKEAVKSLAAKRA